MHKYKEGKSNYKNAAHKVKSVNFIHPIPHSLTLLLAITFTLGACSLGEQPHPNEANNTFIITRTGQSLELFGRASKALSFPDQTPVYRLYFARYSDDLISRIIFTIDVPRDTGTYKIFAPYGEADPEKAKEAQGSIYTLVADGDVLGDYWHPIYPDTSSVTLTRITDEELEGSFSFIGVKPEHLLGHPDPVNPDTLYLDHGVFHIPIVRYLY